METDTNGAPEGATNDEPRDQTAMLSDLLDKFDAEPAPREANQNTGAEPGTGLSETEATGDDNGQTDPENPPAIEPPKSWSAEKREAFKALPEDVQSYITERENERDRETNRHMTDAQQAKQAAEAEKARVGTEAAKEVDALKGLRTLLEHQLLGDFGQINWAVLAQQDPAEYVRLSALYQQRRGQIDAAQAEIGKREQEKNAGFERQRQADIQSHIAKLVDAIPELKDSAKREPITKAISEQAAKLGISKEELSTVVDHRAYIALHKAALYDALMAQKAVAEKKTADVPRMLPPGAGRSGERTPTDKAKTTTVARHGKTQDQAAALARLLG